MNAETTLITGASRGIGRAIALHLARRQHHLILNFHSNEEAARATMISCLELGAASVECVKADAGSKTGQDEIIAKVRSRGELSGLVCNAALIAPDVLKHLKISEMNLSWERNTFGPSRLALEVKDYMIGSAKPASVVMIGTVVGETGEAGNSSYVSSKSALSAAVKSLARQLGPLGIRVNLVSPGFIETDLTATFPPSIREYLIKRIPLARFGKPEDVAQAVDFLLGDTSRFITGQVIRVNGGRLM